MLKKFKLRLFIFLFPEAYNYLCRWTEEPLIDNGEPMWLAKDSSYEPDAGEKSRWWVRRWFAEEIIKRIKD